MKKIVIFLIALLMAVTCFADGSSETTFEYAEEDITIVFGEDSAFSEAEKQYIADYLVYGESDDGASTYAWCWLTGHDKTTEVVTLIHHKVNEFEPRCKVIPKEITTCSKCDFKEVVELPTSFIICCPED